MKQLALLLFLRIIILQCMAATILPGAYQTDDYLELLRGKRIGLTANHTSLVGQTHLVDTLLSLHLNLKKIFAPEHGFRGNMDAGAKVNNTVDPVTHLPVISLYGNKYKPGEQDLKDLDIMVFDIQDVGVRFYTYLSTLHYVMEACAEKNIPLLLLDRPNPLSSCIDGPVLDTNFRSFVGLHPVPVLYGMTIGEYAGMINGEGWLKGGIHCTLTVIPCKGYNHQNRYILPVKPSPNLTTMLAVYLYPSLAFFEGTQVSVGRGTDFPFTVYGFPGMKNADFYFTPRSIKGISKHPLHEGNKCSGRDLRKEFADTAELSPCLHLGFLRDAWENTENKQNFFNSYFNLLSGNSSLQEQIKNEVPEEEIRKAWEKDLKHFTIIRSKYLLYP